MSPHLHRSGHVDAGRIEAYHGIGVLRFLTEGDPRPGPECHELLPRHDAKMTRGRVVDAQIASLSIEGDGVGRAPVFGFVQGRLYRGS